MQIHMTTHFKSTIATLGLILVGAVALLALQGDSVKTANAPAATTATQTSHNDAYDLSRTDPSIKVVHSVDEWRKLLTPEQFRVAREAGTERAFTGATWNNHEHGTYRCVACGLDLFSSDTKYESGTGWPSFWQPAGARPRDDQEGPLLPDGARGSRLRALRQPSRPRLRRRPAADRQALLHELGGAEVREELRAPRDRLRVRTRPGLKPAPTGERWPIAAAPIQSR